MIFVIDGSNWVQLHPPRRDQGYACRNPIVNNALLHSRGVSLVDGVRNIPRRHQGPGVTFARPTTVVPVQPTAVVVVKGPQFFSQLSVVDDARRVLKAGEGMNSDPIHDATDCDSRKQQTQAGEHGRATAHTKLIDGWKQIAQKRLCLFVSAAVGWCNYW